MELLFNKESYTKFLKDKKPIYNSRLRGDDETFLDAMMSEDADLRNTEEGRKIISYIQAIGND